MDGRDGSSMRDCIEEPIFAKYQLARHHLLHIFPFTLTQHLPIYRGDERGSERLSNMPRVAQLLNVRVRIWSWFL